MSKKLKTQFFLLMTVILVPVVAGTLVHYWDVLVPSNTKNYGTLAEPLVTLPEFSANKADGTVITKADMQGIWTVVYIGDGSCETACQRMLIKIKEARAGLAGDSKRLQYMYISTQAMPASMAQGLTEDHARMLIMIADKPELSGVVNSFVTTNVSDLVAAKKIYLVDPHGNYMMHYPEDFAINGLLRDLRHLLKFVGY